MWNTKFETNVTSFASIAPLKVAEENKIYMKMFDLTLNRNRIVLGQSSHSPSILQMSNTKSIAEQAALLLSFSCTLSDNSSVVSPHDDPDIIYNEDRLWIRGLKCHVFDSRYRKLFLQ